ncbi:MAG: VTT domain-containing protein [Gemmatimonadota bacterium]|nr:MAG: VTT domain-containing protein [Gemmatimonadota bacterium]
MDLTEHGLLYYFFYMMVACTFFPLPTPPTVIYMGQNYPSWIVALIGAAGSCVAGLIDYIVFSQLLKYKKVARIKETKTFQSFRKFFNKVAFVSMITAAFTPIPFDPFRFMAITTNYSKLKYVVAIFVGRGSRYYLLAAFGALVPVPTWILVGAFVVLLAISVVKNYNRIVSYAGILRRKIVEKLRARRKTLDLNE